MIKITGGLLALIVAAVSWVVWQKRQSDARVRLREIDEGRRCIACDGTAMAAERDVARCQRCGHTVSLAVMRAASISPNEIADVTKPPQDRRW